MHLDPVVGYQTARKQLDDRYGRQDLVVTAYVNKVLNWPDISRNNFEALDEFSLVLSTCNNALLGTSFSHASLHNAETIAKIVAKLPFYMQDKWLRLADDIMNRQGREVKFEDLVDYVSLEARILNNPLFRRNVNLKDKRKQVKDTHIERLNVNIEDVNENKKI